MSKHTRDMSVCQCGAPDTARDRAAGHVEPAVIRGSGNVFRDFRHRCRRYPWVYSFGELGVLSLPAFPRSRM